MNGNAYSSFGHYNWAYDGAARRENGVNAHARTVAQERRRLENSRVSTTVRPLLPVAQAIAAKHLDKATVIRLASVYIRLNNAHFRLLLAFFDVRRCWTAFSCVLSFDATVLYVSETISQHLGLSQASPLDSSSFLPTLSDRSSCVGARSSTTFHPADVSFGRHRLAQFQEGALPELFLNLRIKSTLTKRRNRESPNCAAGYKVVSIELNNRVSGSFFAFCQPHSSRISNGNSSHAQSRIPCTRSCEWGVRFTTAFIPTTSTWWLEMHHQLRVLGSHRTPFMIATLYSNPQKRALNSNGGGHSSRISIIVTMLG
ncbi:BHLH domain-containing protein [Aphelenchoides fujianensis]|nr:BHLH domain-containing protein [Aphelenchoides fujianensis]